MTELTILLVLMIIGSIAALEMRSLISSVVAVGAVGLLLCITFLILQAPDVAITQLVVELLALVILIRATIRRDLRMTGRSRWKPQAWVSLGFIALLVWVSVRCFQELAPFGEPLMRVASRYTQYGLADTGAANAVAAVILDYRALDTLGEATVLFTAVIGVLAVVRRIGRRQSHKVEEEEGQS